MNDLSIDPCTRTPPLPHNVQDMNLPAPPVEPLVPPPTYVPAPPLKPGTAARRPSPKASLADPPPPPYVPPLPNTPNLLGPNLFSHQTEITIECDALLFQSLEEQQYRELNKDSKATLAFYMVAHLYVLVGFVENLVKGTLEELVYWKPQKEIDLILQTTYKFKKYSFPKEVFKIFTQIEFNENLNFSTLLLDLNSRYLYEIYESAQSNPHIKNIIKSKLTLLDISVKKQEKIIQDVLRSKRLLYRNVSRLLSSLLVLIQNSHSLLLQIFNLLQPCSKQEPHPEITSISQSFLKASPQLSLILSEIEKEKLFFSNLNTLALSLVVPARLKLDLVTFGRRFIHSGSFTNYAISGGTFKGVGQIYAFLFSDVVVFASPREKVLKRQWTQNVSSKREEEETTTKNKVFEFMYLDDIKLKEQRVGSLNLIQFSSGGGKNQFLGIEGSGQNEWIHTWRNQIKTWRNKRQGATPTRATQRTKSTTSTPPTLLPKQKSQKHTPTSHSKPDPKHPNVQFVD